MTKLIELLDFDKKKRKKLKKNSSTQSTTDGSIEDNSSTQKKNSRARNKNSTIDNSQSSGNNPRKRRRSNKKLKKGYEVTTKKIIHDPKLIGALQSLPLFYQQIVVPVKDRHQYNDITKSVGWDFNEILAKPSVLVIGTPEAGKTSFINYLLREKKGYHSHYDAIKDFKSSFTHLYYEDKAALQRGTDAASLNSWQFCKITKYNKPKNDCQIQLLQIKNQLLKEITFIDSPPLSDSMISSMDKETTSGYFPILNNLIRKVDLILFVATSNVVTTSMSKIIATLSPYISKTIFCLNKSDKYKSFDSLTKDRKAFTDYILTSITTGEPKILCTYVKGYLSNSEVKNYIHNDMETLLLRIKKLPTQYKIARLHSLNIHMMECLYIAYIHNEMRKKERKTNVKIISLEDVGELNKCINDVPKSEFFLKTFPTIISIVSEVSDSIKPKCVKLDDVDALKSFLINDFPYITTVAGEEPEILLTFILPVSDPNKDVDAPVKEKKKVIKEIKIALPMNDDEEEEEEEDDNDSNVTNANKTITNEKDQNKLKKKQKFIKINKSTIDKLMKDAQ